MHVHEVVREASQSGTTCVSTDAWRVRLGGRGRAPPSGLDHVNLGIRCPYSTEAHLAAHSGAHQRSARASDHR